MNESEDEYNIDKIMYARGGNLVFDKIDENSPFNDVHIANQNVINEIENEFGPQNQS